MLLSRRLLCSAMETGGLAGDLLFFNYWDTGGGPFTEIYLGKSGAQTSAPPYTYALPTDANITDYEGCASVLKVGNYIYVVLKAFVNDISELRNVLVKYNAGTMTPVGAPIVLSSNYYGNKSLAYDSANNKLYACLGNNQGIGAFNQVVDKIDLATFTLDGSLTLTDYRPCDNGPWYGGACVGNGKLYLSLTYYGVNPSGEYKLLEVDLSTFTAGSSYDQVALFGSEVAYPDQSFATDILYFGGSLYAVGQANIYVDAVLTSTPTIIKLNPSGMTVVQRQHMTFAAGAYAERFTSVGVDTSGNLYAVGNIWPSASSTDPAVKNQSPVFKFNPGLTSYESVLVPCYKDSRNIGLAGLLVSGAKAYVCESGPNAYPDSGERQVSIVDQATMAKDATFNTQAILNSSDYLLAGWWIIKN